MALLLRGTPMGHYKIVVIAYKWKCYYTGKVVSLPVYMIQTGLQVPYYAELATFGFAVFTVTILGLAVHMYLKATEAKDRGRQILSLGIITSIVGTWTLIVNAYMDLKVATGGRMVLDSFLYGWVPITTTVLELVGSAMMIVGSVMIVRRKLTF